jgi:DNA-binding transcriptional regulator YhcF (GntR family)
MKKTPQYTPTGCLMNAIRRDLEKNSEDSTAGMRSTREVAEFTGLKPDRARRELWKLVDVGLVNVYDGKGVTNGEGNLWCLKRLPIPGEKVKVIRPISARDTEVEATLLGYVPSSVLPVQVSFADGERTGYLHQEIREIVG